MVEIRNKSNGEVICGGETLTDAIRAVSRDPLGRRDLTGADLHGADLHGADLRGVDLRGVVLTGADLSGADLRGVVLARADLSGADLSGADLRGALFRGSNLTGADLTGAILLPGVPVVEHLDERILQLVESGAGTLYMGDWHTCDTTHCLAGWAVHLAGEAGQQLEEQYGPAVAGALIYWVSTGGIPNFFCFEEEALEALKQRVARAKLRPAP